MKDLFKETLENINITDKYVCFWGSVFSNFHPCKIHVMYDLWDDVNYNADFTFKSSEQYFMWLKARYFFDDNIADEILKAKTPKDAKSLGRKVRGFEEEEWEHAREEAMYDAVYEKFSQNEDLKEILLNPIFDGKHFVEGSPTDKVYGVGIKWDSPEIGDETNWNGLNLLGKILDDVRETLIFEESDNELPW